MFSADRWRHEKICQSYLRHRLASLMLEAENTCFLKTLILLFLFVTFLFDNFFHNEFLKYLMSRCLVYIRIMILISCGNASGLTSVHIVFSAVLSCQRKNHELWTHDKLGKLEKNPPMSVLH